MNNYFQVKSVGENVYYKVRALGMDWHDDSVPQNDFQFTLNNKLSMTFGNSYDVYRGIARLRNPDDSGYVTLAKFREWVKSNQFANRQLWLIDHDANPAVAVFLVVPITPEYLDSMKKNILVPVEFWQRA